MINPPVIYAKQEDVPAGARMVEAYDSALNELFFIRNPRFKKPMPEAQAPRAEFLAQASREIPAVWIYYPWAHVAVRTVPEDIYFELRTSRNRNIIMPDAQQAYRNLKMGVAGLSVGSAVIGALAISGGPKQLKIADFDVLEVSNLNRLRGTLLQVGLNKAEIAARGVWEIDPFAQLEVWGDGISAETLERFLAAPRLDIFVDEMDSIDLKIKSRFVARAHRIPVVMATDNGDGVIVDVERFDEEPERAIFHGLIDDLNPEELGAIDFKMWLALATRIVGPEYLPPAMHRSIVEIGKSLAAVPQLGTSAQMAGAAIAYVARRIANREPMPSGRYTITLESQFIPDYHGEQETAMRAESLASFKRAFGAPPASPA